MTDYGPSIKLAKLYEKTSKSGNVYMTGRIGGAKVALLKSRETQDDGGAIWEIVLTQANDKAVVYSPAVSNDPRPEPARAAQWSNDLNGRTADDPELVPF